MVHIDQDSIAPRRFALDPQPIPVVRHIDLNDESISAVLRREFASIECLAAEIQRGVIDTLRAFEFAALLERVRSPHTVDSELRQMIPAALIREATAAELGQLLGALAARNPSPQGLGCITRVLEHVRYGANLAPRDRQELLCAIIRGGFGHFGKLLVQLPEQGARDTMLSSWFESELRAIAARVPDRSQRERFLQEGLPLRDLIEVLQITTSTERFSVLHKLVSLAGEQPELYHIVLDKLDNALRVSSLAERAAVGKSILALASNAPRDELMSALLRTSASLLDLRVLVEQLGLGALTALGSASREMAAHALIGHEIQSRMYPELRLYPPTKKMAAQSLEQLRAVLGEVAHALDDVAGGASDVSDTQVMKDARALLRERTAEIDSLLRARDADNFSTRAAYLVLLVPTELRYGVHITTGESEELSKEGCGAFRFPFLAPKDNEPLAWSYEDLKDIVAVLERIPQAHLLFSDMLRDIELVETLGDGVLGARYRADGKIKIARMTINHGGLSAQYEGVSSLRIVLAHEIGHGLQIGDGPAGYSATFSAQPGHGAGEARYDFDEYIALSGWTVYSRDRFQRSSDAGKIILDGTEVPLDQPVLVAGKNVVLRFNAYANLLTSYDADSDFSSRWYAKASPWEDFAEAFSEYLFTPERLKKDAPGKFRHLEQEFGRYGGPRQQ